MKKIIEYKIASGESKYELQEEVNELIKQKMFIKLVRIMI